MPPRVPIIVNDIIEDRSIRRANNASYVKRYKKGKYLGKGGFAKCYEMTSFDSNRTYAGKVIPKASLKKQSARDKLLNEIKIHRSLDYPNVVKFERFFEDPDNVYILLELCTNYTLMELVKRRKRLTETETQFYMWQMLLTCEYLHKSNVIHRDLKLGNLFLDSEMNIKAGDFGLATRLDHPEERKRTICGTPNYIAPEILDSRDGHSFEVDVWSIGVIMYTMLIGRPPFETASVKSTYKKIRANSYTFPPHIRISAAAKGLITRILHAKPSMRPTIQEMKGHAFFSQSPFPKSLPDSCLVRPLQWQHTCHPNNPEHPLRVSAPSKQLDSNKQQPSKPRAPLGQINANSNGGGNHRGHIAYTSNGNPGHSNHHQQHAQPRTTRQSVASRRAAISPSKHARAHRMRSAMQHQQQQPTSTADHDFPERLGAREEMRQGGGRPGRQEDPREMDDVRRIHADIEASFSARPSDHKAKASAKLAAAPASAATRAPAADLWVNKWVDYSNKYGLGYLLCNHNSGVYFNDSSKAVLHANGQDFEYIEQRRSNGTGGERQHHTLSNYPSSLEKKVTLLKHFMNYLVQHNGKDKDNKKAAQQQSGDAMADDTAENAAAAAEQSSPREMVYVKKWLRTKHAILFRLSNRVVQVIFYDHTEIVLSSEERLVTYTNKLRERRTYPLDSVFANPRPDLAKRMKYTKDILFHLLSRNGSGGVRSSPLSARR